MVVPKPKALGLSDPGSKIFFWISASVFDNAVFNPSGTKTFLGDGKLS